MDRPDAPTPPAPSADTTGAGPTPAERATGSIDGDADARIDPRIDGQPADPVPSAMPGDRPPVGRRLDVAPSTRYATGDPATVVDDASPRRGVLFGTLVALFVGLVMVLLGSVLGITAGLVVAAFFLGQLTAVGVRAGSGGSQGQTARAWTAVLLALGALVLVQLGLWLWARAEGGTLGPVDYLRDVFGALVAIEAVLAAVGAWWGSR